MSPVSGTTNLAAMMSAEADLCAYIRSMLYNTAPTYVIALISFAAMRSQCAYQARLRRNPVLTQVNEEGLAVRTQEYLRHRVYGDSGPKG